MKVTRKLRPILFVAKNMHSQRAARADTMAVGRSFAVEWCDLSATFAMGRAHTYNAVSGEQR